MIDIILKILPVILIFVLGIILRLTKVLGIKDADLFLKFVFYVSLPSLILATIPQIKLSHEDALLPLISAGIILFSFVASTLISKFLKLEKDKKGVLLVGTMVLNIGFTIPFVFAYYGKDGLAKLILFDFANAIIAYSFVYYLAIKNGSRNSDKNTIVSKLIKSPPIWAIIISCCLNLFKINLPAPLFDLFDIMGKVAIPLLMISIGLYFSPKLINLKLVSIGIIIRMLFGFALGLVVVQILGIEGINKSIILIGASAPIGFNTLTYASLENLDQGFAASLISYSIIVGLIITPLLILFS